VKLVKTANGKSQVKMSRKEWEAIGKKAGWIKEAQLQMGGYDNNLLEVEMVLRQALPGLQFTQTADADGVISFDAAELYERDPEGTRDMLERAMEVARNRLPDMDVSTTGTAYTITRREPPV